MADFRALARGIAVKHGLDPDMFEAQIEQESGFNPQARSPAGAIGLGQLMPATARELGVQNPADPVQNLEGAARYMKQQLSTFGGDYRLALAAYNAGPGAVQKAGGIPGYRETQDYVTRITGKAAARRGAAAQQGIKPSTTAAPVVAAPAASPTPSTASMDPLTALVQASLIPVVPAAPLPEMPDTRFSPRATRAPGEEPFAPRMAGKGLNAGLTGLILGAIQGAAPRPASGASSGGQTFPSATPAGFMASKPVTTAPAAIVSQPASVGSSGSSPLIGIVDLGRMVEGTRMRVREHPEFGDGRVGKHSKNSLHYKGLALDITDWEDPGESEKSWKPRKAWLGQQIQQLLAGTNAEVFGPHNDPAGHGSHIHLGLPSGSIRADLAQGIVRLRQEALKRYPLRWAG